MARQTTQVTTTAAGVTHKAYNKILKSLSDDGNQGTPLARDR